MSIDPTLATRQSPCSGVRPMSAKMSIPGATVVDGVAGEPLDSAAKAAPPARPTMAIAATDEAIKVLRMAANVVRRWFGVLR